MRRWPFFAILAALAACGGSDGTGPVPAISGRYNLASIDGKAPPVTLPVVTFGVTCGFDILAWSWTVTSATQMAVELRTQGSGPGSCVYQPITQQGTLAYRQQGTLILFPTATRTDTGSVSNGGQTITLKMLWNVEDDGDTVFIRPVFRKAA